MARPATGSPAWNPTERRWEARITINGHGRRPYPMVDKAGRALVPPCLNGTPDATRDGCACTSCRQAANVAKLMSDRMRGEGRVPAGASLTVSEWFGKWFDWRKRRGWGDAEKLRGQFRKHVEPVLGTYEMHAVTRAQIKAIVLKLDDAVRAGEISWKTALNIWSQSISKPFKDATNGKEPSLCILDANPAAGVAPPDKGARTKKQYLYPDEALKLLACEDVPLWRRELYAVAIYTYMRAGELAALRWEDVDVDRGIITVHQSVTRGQKGAKVKATKTDAERRVIIEPTLRPLLARLSKAAAGALVFPKLPPYNGNDGAAPTLRADLEKAGVKRAALLVPAATRKRMTFHDLRATGITWAAIRGDDALKIMSRSGHTEYQTMMAYVREAEVVRDGFGDVFPELPEPLRGSGGVLAFWLSNSEKQRSKQRPQGDSNPC